MVPGCVGLDRFHCISSSWFFNTRSFYLQACTCIDFSPVKPDGIVRTTVSNTDSAPVMSHQKIDAKLMPLIAAGYSDGTVRVFDINKAEMILKMHPHAVSVTAISFSSDGLFISFMKLNSCQNM